MSLLASTISIFESSVAKNGHSEAIACRRGMPLSGWASTQAVTAEPNPYQAGSIRRHWAQPKTQGIAPQILDPRRLLTRGRPAADMEVGDFADHGRAPEIVLKAFGFVNQRPIGAVGM